MASGRVEDTRPGREREAGRKTLPASVSNPALVNSISPRGRRFNGRGVALDARDSVQLKYELSRQSLRTPKRMVYMIEGTGAVISDLVSPVRPAT